MLVLPAAERDQATLEASPMHNYSSFESFRTSGAKALKTLEAGHIATLRTKSGNYRIVREDDFRRLAGLLESVHAVHKRLQVVVRVARTVITHRDAPHFEALESAVDAAVASPGIHTQEGHGNLPVFDRGDSDDDTVDDDAVVDAKAIHRDMGMA